MRSSRRIILLLSSVVLWAACTDDPVAPPSVVFPERGVSFNMHVKPVLLNNCAISGCHDGYSYEPDNPSRLVVRLESYSDLLSAGVISPLEPDRSRLALVLCGDLLHPASVYFSALNENQRAGIIQWIREGALNN
ncbi:MAG TPA: hypothetical protein VNA88_14360 [Candidatus Kapabacteria bacterium]|jgi:hypothetical protein|nr:hypothetical protein [Candidatus Kapabacteria bacterium]